LAEIKQEGGTNFRQNYLLMAEEVFDLERKLYSTREWINKWADWERAEAILSEIKTILSSQKEKVNERNESREKLLPLLKEIQLVANENLIAKIVAVWN